jgi:ribosomal protein S18 acetylase RimI-like enzyme
MFPEKFSAKLKTQGKYPFRFAASPCKPLSTRKTISMFEMITPTATFRRLGPADLSAYKALRDDSLRQHPDAFSFDLETEQQRSPESYLGRLGLVEPLGGTFLLGAWSHKNQLVGCICCERSTIVKTRHRAEIFGLFVRQECSDRGIGSSLVREAIQTAREAISLKMITAIVTATDERVVKIYEDAGFSKYGLLPKALRVVTRQGETYYDKAEMVLMF